MFKLAFKNLWSQRRTNIWLLLELIAVTIVGWLIINPVVVYVYDSLYPLGYDIDRLVCVGVKSYPKDSGRFNPAMDEQKVKTDAFLSIRGKLQADPRVESVSIGNSGNLPVVGGLVHSNRTHEGKEISLMQVTFYQGTDYFRTLGLKAADYGPSADELSDADLNSRKVAITKVVADSLFPGENPMGRIIGSDTTDHYYIVAGVLENVRMKPHMRENKVIFRNEPFSQVSDYRNNFLVRLRPGVSARDFVADKALESSLPTGNWYVNEFMTISDEEEEQELLYGITNSVVIGTVLTLFFLLMLVLGVSGLFWMQTRRRSRDAGIMKAFGASPSYVVRMLMLEGAILTVTGWFVGSLLYLQYVVSEGFHDLRSDKAYDWVDDFSLHFVVIAAILLLLMLAAVIIGIMVPARKIATVPPVDALRDE